MLLNIMFYIHSYFKIVAEMNFKKTFEKKLPNVNRCEQNYFILDALEKESLCVLAETILIKLL